MQIIINGDAHDMPTPLTITALLQHLQVDSTQVAVECNAEIISRSRYDATHVKAGDRIELVEFVGGG